MLLGEQGAEDYGVLLILSSYPQIFGDLIKQFLLWHNIIYDLCCVHPPIGRGRGDGGYVRQTSYEETRGEGGGGFGRGMDTRRQGWNETRLVVLYSLTLKLVMVIGYINTVGRAGIAM